MSIEKVSIHTKKTTCRRYVDESCIFTFMKEVKDRKQGTSRISSKNQVSLPVEAMRQAGLQSGERLVARADGPGRIILEREDDPISQFAGVLTGVYAKNEIEKLRSEWE